MPRPERPVNPSAGPLQAFAVELRSLREQAGNPKYLLMARISGRSRTALAEAAGGDHLPTWETVDAYVRACGGDPSAWRVRWEQVQALNQAKMTSVFDTAQPEPAAMLADRRHQTANPDVAQSESASSTNVLLLMWQEQRAQARQCENQRAVMTAVLSVVASLAVPYFAFHDNSVLQEALISLSLITLGIFGALTTAKYYERFKMHMDGAQAIRLRLDRLHPDLCLVKDWANNRTQHQRNFSTLYRIPLHYLWVLLHAGIATTGLTLTIIVIITRWAKVA